MPRGSTYSPEAMSARRASSGVPPLPAAMNGHAEHARQQSLPEPAPPTQVPAPSLLGSECEHGPAAQMSLSTACIQICPLAGRGAHADLSVPDQGGYPPQLADIFRDLQASWHTLDDKGPIFQRLHAFCTAHPEVGIWQQVTQAGSAALQKEDQALGCRGLDTGPVFRRLQANAPITQRGASDEGRASAVPANLFIHCFQGVASSGQGEGSGCSQA